MDISNSLGNNLRKREKMLRKVGIIFAEFKESSKEKLAHKGSSEIDLALLYLAKWHMLDLVSSHEQL